MGLAAQIAALGKLWPAGYASTASPSGSAPPTDTWPPVVPANAFLIEMFLGGQWVNVTPYVRYDEKIKITRGKGSESARAVPMSCTMKLKNGDKRWAPRNKTGPYYGMLVPGVQIRVSVNPGSGWYRRFTGRVIEFPPKWTTGNDRWVIITCKGVLYRLQQGKGALQPALYRATQALGPTNFFPLNEGTNGTSGKNLLGGPDLQVVSGTVSWGGTTDMVGQPVAPTITSGNLSASLITSTTSAWSFVYAFKGTESALSSPLVINVDGGAFTQVQVLQQVGGVIGIQLRLTNASGPSDYFGTGPISTAAWNTGWHHVVGTFGSDASGNLRVRLYLDGVSQIPSPIFGAGVAGTPRFIQVNSLWDNTLTSMSSLAFYGKELTAADAVKLSNAVSAYAGERPTDRFARLCTEESVPYIINELVVDTELMGPQLAKSLLTLLQECEDVNEGFIDEAVTGELRLNSRSFGWNQAVSMQVDYVNDDVSQDMEPIDDTVFLRNDWTIDRPNGATANYQKTTGPLNINNPEDDPQGRSQFDDSATLNVLTDTQPLQHAAYRVARGTIDQVRFNKIPLHFVRNKNLLTPWLAMDNGRRMWLTNSPQDVGGGTLDQRMIGYTETIDQFEWKADAIAQPFAIDDTGIIDTYGFIDCRASTVSVAMSPTDTAMQLNITDLCVWVSTSLPVSITVLGEEMTLTAVGVPAGTPNNYTQTLTVTRSVNGVVKSIPAHSAAYPVYVNVTQPFILAL